METKYISCTETAKLIRKDLKNAFPNTKFSINSMSYSGGASVSIDWIDGAGVDEVEKIINKYKGASFDGMQDLKSYNYVEENGVKIQYGSDYIHLNRTFSEESNKRMSEYLVNAYEIQDFNGDLGSNLNVMNELVNMAQLIWRQFRDKNINEINKILEAN